MESTNIDDLPPDEMESAHVSFWERENIDGVNPETSTPGEQGRTYGNLWLSEEDPRAIPAPNPEDICPTHHIACKKGICEYMSKLIKARERKARQAEWEKKKKNKKGTFCCHILLVVSWFEFFNFLIFILNR